MVSPESLFKSKTWSVWKSRVIKEPCPEKKIPLIVETVQSKNRNWYNRNCWKKSNRKKYMERGPGLVKFTLWEGSIRNEREKE